MRIKSIYKKNKELYNSLLINFSVLAFYLLFFYTRLETKNDVFMKSIIEGTNSYGKSLAHIFFSDIIIGEILCGAQSLIPGIPWYSVFHCLMCFICLTVITYVLLRKNPRKTGVFPVIIIGVFIGYEAYCRINYFKTSMLLICAAWVLFLYFCDRLISWYSWIWVYGLAFMSSLISFRMFSMGMICWLVLVTCFCIIERKIRSIWKFLIIFIIPVEIISSACLYMDFRMYTGKPGWEYGGRYRQAIEKNIMYGYSPYEDGFGYDEGIENDYCYYNLAQGYLYNLDEQALDLISEISEIPYETSFDNIMLFFRRIPIGFLGQFIFYAMAVLWMLLIYFKIPHKEIYIGMTGLGLLATAFPLFMMYAMGTSWIYVCVCFPYILFTSFLFDNIESKENRIIIVYFIIFMVIIYNRFSGRLYGAPLKNNYAEVASEFEQGVVYIADLRSYLGSMSPWTVYQRQMAVVPEFFIIDGIYGLIPDYYDSVLYDMNPEDIRVAHYNVYLNRLRELYGWPYGDEETEVEFDENDKIDDEDEKLEETDEEPEDQDEENEESEDIDETDVETDH